MRASDALWKDFATRETQRRIYFRDRCEPWSRSTQGIHHRSERSFWAALLLSERQSIASVAFIADGPVPMITSPLLAGNSTICIPDSVSMPEALGRVTHLGVGAHQDEREFMAFQGIAECYGSHELWFGGVTCTDGKGSSRNLAYANSPPRAGGSRKNRSFWDNDPTWTLQLRGHQSTIRSLA